MIEVEVSRELEPLIPKFLENRSREIEAARTLLGKQDFQSLDRYGHSLKGVCMGYGFRIVIPVADEIQAAAAAKAPERIERALEKVRELFSDVRIRYI